MKKLTLLALSFLLFPLVTFGATFSHNMSYGTVGTEVSQLQQFLADEGLYSGQITAFFGSATQSALISFQKQEGLPATGYFGTLSRTDAENVLVAHPEWTTTLSNGNTYSNVNGNTVKTPAYSSNGIPSGATAQCKDGTYSFSLHHSGTCSGHRGVSSWLK